MAIFKRNKNKNKPSMLQGTSPLLQGNQLGQKKTTNMTSGTPKTQGSTSSVAGMTMGQPASSGNNFSTPAKQTYVAPPSFNTQSVTMPSSISYTGGGSFGTGSIGVAQQGLAQQIGLLSSAARGDVDFTSLQDALTKNKNDYSKYYDELRTYKSKGFEDYLNQTQGELDASLAGLEQDFSEDRLAADVKEAQSGTLFSTGRRERRQSMQDKYQRAGDTARLRAESGLRNAARDFEYQLGADALDGMNMRLGSTTFNAGGTRPTTSRRLTRAYRPEGYVGSVNEDERKNYLTQGTETFNQRVNRGLPGNF